MIDFTLTDENRLVQQSARSFAEAEILPNIRDWDARGEVHREVFAKMGKSFDDTDEGGPPVASRREVAPPALPVGVWLDPPWPFVRSRASSSTPSHSPRAT